ncbi:hypothetical protein JHK87_006644 [Glycine soja]|nr:hypothetical protein JHK87_006644 [Glycine soja]
MPPQPQIIQQSTGLDLGWQDDPCLPSPWEKIDCEGSLVTSLDLHNTSLTGEIKIWMACNILRNCNASKEHELEWSSGLYMYELGGIWKPTNYKVHYNSL